MLPFMDSYHHNFMLEDIFYTTGARDNLRDNQLRYTGHTCPVQLKRINLHFNSKVSFGVSYQPKGVGRGSYVYR